MWSVCSPIHCKPVLGSHGHLWLVEAGQTSEETSLTAVTVHLYEYVKKSACITILLFFQKGLMIVQPKIKMYLHGFLFFIEHKIDILKNVNAYIM